MASGQIVRGPHGGLVAPAGEACGRCGVRADVGCKHRPAAGVKPIAIATGDDPPKRDGRSRPGKLQGLGFHRERLTRNLEAAKKALGTRSRDD